MLFASHFVYLALVIEIIEVYLHETIRLLAFKQSVRQISNFNFVYWSLQKSDFSNDL